VYKLVFSNKFEKRLKKLTASNKSLKFQAKKTVELIRIDIDHPSLRMHKLNNQKWSVSVNKSMSMILKIDKDEIFVLDIGTHEDVY
jgi:mRNA-degrading endonuclease YafQ of YafQ-DinJ toxin-antitoxin module